MPLTYKTKDRLFYLLLLALLVAEGYFAYRYLWPVHQRRLEATEYINQALASDRKRIAKPEDLPGQKVVLACKDYQKSMLREYANVEDFYLKHDAPLERHILDGDKVDEIRIVVNYTELKKRWARKVGWPDFLKNWSWERPDGRLPSKDFAYVEKWCCVVDTIVDTIAAEGSVEVRRIAVGKAFVPADVPRVPEVTWGVGVLRYKVWPVRIYFDASFMRLARIVERFVQRPDDLPCVEIKRLDFNAPESTDKIGPTARKQGRVNVYMEVWVYDFEVVQKGAKQMP